MSKTRKIRLGTTNLRKYRLPLATAAILAIIFLAATNGREAISRFSSIFTATQVVAPTEVEVLPSPTSTPIIQTTSTEPATETQTQETQVFEAVTPTITTVPTSTPLPTATQFFDYSWGAPIVFNLSDHEFRLGDVCYDVSPEWDIYVKSGYQDDCLEGDDRVDLSGETIIPHDMAVVPSTSINLSNFYQEHSMGNRTIRPAKTEGMTKVCAVKISQEVTVVLQGGGNRTRTYIRNSRRIFAVSETVTFDTPDVLSADIGREYGSGCYEVPNGLVHDAIVTLISESHGWIMDYQNQGYYNIVIPDTYQGLWFGNLAQAKLPEYDK